ncbi:hypothetical protein [Burkholderia metallica]|uniref:hypothetical protein n=1 Tax=Burkholderia metallica TaxID=488729 RepID=UPI0012F4DE82|nr:hypothetical protein [Burkholderia metallica]
MTSALGVATFTARDPCQALVQAGAQRPTFNVQRSLSGAARVIRDPSTSFRSAIALRQTIGGLDSTGYETKPLLDKRNAAVFPMPSDQRAQRDAIRAKRSALPCSKRSRFLTVIDFREEAVG